MKQNEFIEAKLPEEKTQSGMLLTSLSPDAQKVLENMASLVCHFSNIMMPNKDPLTSYLVLEFLGEMEAAFLQMLVVCIKDVDRISIFLKKHSVEYLDEDMKAIMEMYSEE